MDIKELGQKNVKESSDKELSEDKVNEYVELFKNWGLDDDGQLVTNFEADDFESIRSIFNKIADLAEKEGHHPNFFIYDYNNLLVQLFTHDAEGLTEKDFVMAAKIEEMFVETEEIKN